MKRGEWRDAHVPRWLLDDPPNALAAAANSLIIGPLSPSERALLRGFFVEDEASQSYRNAGFIRLIAIFDPPEGA